MKTCIIAGGMLEREFALRFIQEQNFDIILAADRGLEFCSQENIRPTYILGDFDSLKEGVLDKYKEERDIPIREFNPVKDNTDMDLALQQAIILGSREIHILGGTGGRLDHFFSTVQNLKKAWLKHIPAYLVDSKNLITPPCEKEFVIGGAGDGSDSGRLQVSAGSFHADEHVRRTWRQQRDSGGTGACVVQGWNPADDSVEGLNAMINNSLAG